LLLGLPKKLTHLSLDGFCHASQFGAPASATLLKKKRFVKDLSRDCIKQDSYKGSEKV
jgi:hypothetical protein